MGTERAIMPNYDTFEIATLDADIAGAYEHAASYHAATLLSDLVGTGMHVEAEWDDIESNTLADIPAMSAADLASLAERDTFDWLAS